MTNKTLNFSFTGSSSLVDASLDALVYQNGYKDVVTIVNEDGIPEEVENPVSKHDFAKEFLATVIRHNITSYRKNQAKIQAEQEAEQASETALDKVTMSVSVN